MAGQTLWITLSFIVFSGYVLCQDDQPSVSVDMTQEYAHSGDNVTFTCRASNPGDASIAIYKLVIVDLEDGTTHDKYDQIATGTFIHPKYNEENNGRFEIRKISIGDTVTFIMGMMNVQPEDSGRYVCRILSTEAFGGMNFHVYKNPSKVSFRVNGTDVEDPEQILELEEGEKVDLSCFVSGSIPQPHVHITSAKSNYTKEFTQKSQIMIQCEGQDAGCPMHYTYDTHLVKPDFTPKPIDHGKKLLCNATVFHQKLGSVNATINLSVLFKPLFNCSEQYDAKLHEKNKVIRCPVLYNPGPLFNVSLSMFENEVVLAPGEKAENVKFELEHQSDSLTELVVTISQVASRHFGPFQLSGSTDRGMKDFTFTLLQAGTDESTDDGASSITSSIFSLLAFTLAAIFLQH